MSFFARGAAFVDPAGSVLAADAGFLDELGLTGGDAAAALRARSSGSPPLQAFLAGEGPDRTVVDGPRGEVTLERIPAAGGALLVARVAHDAEWLEHAVRSQWLGRMAGGLAHDIKNPLNAMALQLALLGEKLEGEAGAASASHLGALGDQVAKVNEVVRRFCDVADPPSPFGYVDVGAVVGDIACLFGHEVRRRRVRLELDAPRGVARTGAPAERAVRLLLGLFGRAVAETPDGGTLSAAVTGGEVASLALVHTAGDPDPDLGYYTEVAAAAARALGGSFEHQRADGQERLLLRLPRGGHE
ncbi:MAG TPA: histidine kinase [Anaeromyxobacteraceae bacterium]|nr:histidine kinase [Anaeromyxobacteraceae bacterium]